MTANSNKPSLKDIAAQVGVTSATVSLALRGQGRISAALRRKIKRVAGELGYRPNVSARAIREGRFGAVALLTGPQSPASVASSLVLDGTLEALNKRHLRLILGQMPAIGDTSSEAIPGVLREWSSDGLLVKSIQPPNPRLMQAIRDSGLPVVWLNLDMEFDAVLPDDYRAAREATEHCRKLGHQRIAYLSPYASAEESHYSLREREAGYAEAMKDAGLSPGIFRPVNRIAGEELRGFCREILSSDDRPTALITYYGAEYAPAVFLAAADLGLSIPKDLSLICHGEVDCHANGMQLSMMQIPMDEVGRFAVEMLCDKIEDPGRVFVSSRIPFRFIAGETCACPREA